MDGTLVYLQSEPSKPFIVMTNDGQRCTTEGILLKKQIFSERSEVTTFLSIFLHLEGNILIIKNY